MISCIYRCELFRNVILLVQVFFSPCFIFLVFLWYFLAWRFVIISGALHKKVVRSEAFSEPLVKFLYFKRISFRRMSVLDVFTNKSISEPELERYTKVIYFFRTYLFLLAVIFSGIYFLLFILLSVIKSIFVWVLWNMLMQLKTDLSSNVL